MTTQPPPEQARRLFGDFDELRISNNKYNDLCNVNNELGRQKGAGLDHHKSSCG